MKDLPLVRIAALVPEFAVKDLPLGRTHDDDDDDDLYTVIYGLLVFRNRRLLKTFRFMKGKQK